MEPSYSTIKRNDNYTQNFSMEIWKENATFDIIIGGRIILKWAVNKVHENTDWIHLGQCRENRSAPVNMVMKFPASQTARNLLEQLSDDQFPKDFCPRGYLFLMTLSRYQRVRHSYSVFLMQFFYAHLLPQLTFLCLWEKSAIFQSSPHSVKAT